MIIDDGPFPQGYYDELGRWHYYNPERYMKLQGQGIGSIAACRSCSNGRTRGLGGGLGILGEPADTILLGTATAVGVGTIVWLLMRKRRRRR